MLIFIVMFFYIVSSVVFNDNLKRSAPGEIPIFYTSVYYIQFLGVLIMSLACYSREDFIIIKWVSLITYFAMIKYGVEKNKPLLILPNFAGFFIMLFAIIFF